MRLQTGQVLVLIARVTMCILPLLPFPVTAGEPGDDSQTLEHQLDALSAGFVERAPPEIIKNIQAAIEEVDDSGILDKVLKDGDRAPDFELPDATGEKVKLSTLLQNGPVILTWYRGNW